MVSEIKKGKVEVKKEKDKIFLNGKFRIDQGICNREQFIRLLENENDHLSMSILVVIEQINATDEYITKIVLSQGDNYILTGFELNVNEDYDDRFWDFLWNDIPTYKKSLE